MSDDMFYARVCQERDQLRAELAAAKNRALIAEKQDERSRHLVCLWKDDREAQSRALSAMTAERDALAADNARLRKALEDAFDGAARQLAEPRHHGNDQYALTAIATTCELALAATPAQSPAAHDAALLRDVVDEIEKEAPHA